LLLAIVLDIYGSQPAPCFNDRYLRHERERERNRAQRKGCKNWSLREPNRLNRQCHYIHASLGIANLRVWEINHIPASLGVVHISRVIAYSNSSVLVGCPTSLSRYPAKYFPVNTVVRILYCCVPGAIGQVTAAYPNKELHGLYFVTNPKVVTDPLVDSTA
jgi:hypothetical protein